MKTRPSIHPIYGAVGFLMLMAAASGCTPDSPLDEQEIDSPEPVGEAVHAETVAQAASQSCSTTSVKGLSQQIIDQSQCIDPAAFVQVPAQPNLVLGAAVFPYLELPVAQELLGRLAAEGARTTFRW